MVEHAEELVQDAPQDLWGWQQIIKQARQKLVDNGWPIPSKPATPLKDLEIPDDIEGVPGAHLANLMGRLGAWYSYGTAQLAFARAELAAAEEYFELNLGEQMHTASGTFEKKEVKEVLKAVAITRSTNLRKFMDVKTQLDQRTRAIEGLVSGLEIQCRMLQSEQIRRASERKLIGGDSQL